ncbi:hypothetical protein OAO01_02040 [Oligoflexia bacterium]|nr:hypothetical protein [Oligoflexia bacterium]
MKSRRALAAGGSFGFFLALSAIQFDAAPLHVLFSATLIAFIYSSCSLLFFSVFGWPRRSFGLDIYDINKLVLGATATAASVALLYATAAKVASEFSLNIFWAALVTSVCFAIYLGVGFLLAAIARER